MKWVDITSYSQSDKERTPTTFRVDDGPLDVVITCGHIHYRPEWVMHCRALNIDTKPLQTGITQEEAQQKAMELVQTKIASLAASAERIASLGA